MSKKGSNNVLGGLSFVALILYSIATLLGRLKIEIGPFYWIAQILVLIVVFYTAWVFVRSKSQGWKVIYFVILIVTIVVFVFGNIWWPFSN